MNETIQHIAVDVGYGFVKVLSKDKRIILPTLVGIGMDSNLSDLFVGDNDLKNIYVNYKGEGYFIGELAKESKSPSRVFEQKRYEHEYFKLIVNIAIQLATEGKYQKVMLSTGLPLSYYSSQAGEAKQSLMGIQPEIHWKSGVLAGKTIQNDITNALVFPQGASAIQTALRNHDGMYNYPDLMMEGTLIGLIDIGYRTTDFIVVEMQENGSFVPRPSLSDTIDIGVHSLMQEIERYFKSKTNGADLSEYHLARILNNGFIRYNGEKIDFADYIEEKKVTLANNIADRLKSHWSDESSLFDSIFLAGGGGMMFEQPLQPFFNNRLEVIKESQYANAIGYYRWGNALLSRKRV